MPDDFEYKVLPHEILHEMQEDAQGALDMAHDAAVKGNYDPIVIGPLAAAIYTDKRITRDRLENPAFAPVVIGTTWEEAFSPDAEIEEGKPDA